MAKLEDIYKLTIDKFGRLRIERDEKKILSKLPINQRIARKKSKRVRYQKPKP